MRRVIEVDGEQWDVMPSGRSSFYRQDEYTVLFQRGVGKDRVRRVTKYSPLGAKRPDLALSELSDRQLEYLFATSQPASTSPVTQYTRQFR